MKNAKNKKVIVATSPHKSLRDYAGQAGGAGKKSRVVVALSGGVDSSTAAFLLRKEGYDVTGIFMRLGFPNDKSEAAARQVAKKLGIRFYPVNLTVRFRKEVIDYFLKSYQEGITPNPCVRCNRLIKFGELLRVADELGADYLSTGHYVMKNELCALFRGIDTNKDQSYFLYTLTQDQLKKILFPLGEYTKDEIRKIAAEAGLPHLTGESQDVCFLNSEGKILEHNEYLKKYLKMEPGPIVALASSTPPASAPLQHPPLIRGGTGRGVPAAREGAGKVIGQHQGLPLYTLGQRRGVEIGGTGPYYVAGTDYKTNTLYVVSDANDPALFRDNFIVSEINWVSGFEPEMPLKCEAVIRYRHKAVGCEVASLPLPNTPPASAPLRHPPIIRGGRGRGVPVALEGGVKEYNVKLKEPQRAVTPGQSVVFYDGDEVLGGGVIMPSPDSLRSSPSPAI
ncbi:MAG: tRNA 2-thiouridine(34) synthase MnmA [Candidatus Falkowbacteria bacterium]